MHQLNANELGHHLVVLQLLPSLPEAPSLAFRKAVAKLVKVQNGDIFVAACEASSGGVHGNIICKYGFFQHPRWHRRADVLLSYSFQLGPIYGSIGDISWLVAFDFSSANGRVLYQAKQRWMSRHNPEKYPVVIQLKRGPKTTKISVQLVRL